LAMWKQAQDDRPAIKSLIGESGYHCILNHSLLTRCIEEIGFHRSQVVILSREEAAFAQRLSRKRN
jgi:hypothetical protein